MPRLGGAKIAIKRVMNLLQRNRRYPHELARAVFERGEQMGRAYSLSDAKCGEGKYAIPAVHIRFYEERKGTSFHVTTPFVCRGRLVECIADFFEVEHEQPIEPEEIGAVREAIPPHKTSPDGATS